MTDSSQLMKVVDCQVCPVIDQAILATQIIELELETIGSTSTCPQQNPLNAWASACGTSMLPWQHQSLHGRNIGLGLGPLILDFGLELYKAKIAARSIIAVADEAHATSRGLQLRQCLNRQLRVAQQITSVLCGLAPGHLASRGRGTIPRGPTASLPRQYTTRST